MIAILPAEHGIISQNIVYPPPSNTENIENRITVTAEPPSQVTDEYSIAEGGGELITILSLKREGFSLEEDRYYRYMDEDSEKKIELSESEGIELWNQVDIDAVDNSAPGIDFIPLFNLD